MTAPEVTSVKAELAAMNKIVKIMDGVDRATADRIASWLYDRYADRYADHTAPNETAND